MNILRTVIARAGEMPPHSADAIGIKSSATTTWGGALAGVAGWLSSVNWLGLTGALVAILGLAVNFYFLRRRDKRERELHKAQMAALRERCEL